MSAVAPFKFGPLGLGCIGVAGFCLAFYAFITPLRKHEAQLRTAIEDGRGQISKSREKIDAIHALEKKAVAARDELQNLDSDLPPGSPLVWISPLVKMHFDRLGFASSHASLTSTCDEPGVPGYQRMEWSVAVPVQGVTKRAGDLLAAVAAFDESQPALHVADLEIPREVDKAGKCTAMFHFSMLARK